MYHRDARLKFDQDLSRNNEDFSSEHSLDQLISLTGSSKFAIEDKHRFMIWWRRWSPDKSSSEDQRDGTIEDPED